MAAKIIAFIVTLLINTASAIIILFGMLVAMNGFSESDATWGLGVYIVIAFAAAILMGAAAVFFAGLLLKRQLHAAVSAILAILGFSVAGVAIDIVASLIGIGVAEYVRVSY